MAAVAVAKLKSSVNATLSSALETPPPGSQLSQAKQDELVKETVAAAQQVEQLFEQVKLRQSGPSSGDIQREIDDLQTLITVKDDLLKKSLDSVTAWEAKLAQLREGQKPLLFNP